MKLIIIDRKAWERHCSEFADLSTVSNNSSAIRPKRTNGLTTKPCASVWASAKRTLQSYRDTGKIPFSMIGHKCYYKESDITELLNANNE